MACEDCPIQKAYEDYVITTNLQQEEADTIEVAARTDLCFHDYRVFKSMVAKAKVPAFPTWPDLGRVVMDGSDCDGPKKKLFGFGKLSCSGTIDFIKENREDIFSVKTEEE